MYKQPKKKRSMRCPNCNSLSTKKNGKRKLTYIGFDRKSKKQVQLYRCKKCQKTFSKRRDSHKHYSSGFKEQIVRMHIEERMSFRVMSKRLKERFAVKISAGYLCKVFNETISKVKSSMQIKGQCQPQWEGYLIVDDKMINIKVDKKLSLIAKDRSGDIVHEELLDYIQQDRYDDFLRFIKLRLNYQFKSITTDLDPMLAKAIKTVLPEGCPHQLCLKHTLDNIYRIVKYQTLKVKLNKLEREAQIKQWKLSEDIQQELIKLRGEIEQIDKMIKQTKQFLWNKDRKKSEALLKIIIENYAKKYPDVIDLLTKNKEGLLKHQLDKKIPKTNNDAENTNRQIKRRLKTIEAFQSQKNAENYLIIICNHLRMKPYTDCRGARKYRNGYSPLQLCQAKLSTNDWVKFSLNYL